MLKNEKSQISRETEIDIKEIAELACNLPEKEKERFFYMMKGVELMNGNSFASTVTKAQSVGA